MDPGDALPNKQEMGTATYIGHITILGPFKNPLAKCNGDYGVKPSNFAFLVTIIENS